MSGADFFCHFQSYHFFLIFFQMQFTNFLMQPFALLRTLRLSSFFSLWYSFLFDLCVLLTAVGISHSLLVNLRTNLAFPAEFELLCTLFNTKMKKSFQNNRVSVPILDFRRLVISCEHLEALCIRALRLVLIRNISVSSSNSYTFPWKTLNFLRNVV